MISPLTCKKERVSKEMSATLTILGSGATAMAAAHYFTQQGVQVLLCDTEEREIFFEDIRTQQGITVKGLSAESKVMPEFLTTNFSEAAEFAENLLVCVSADRQTEMAERIAPHLREEHSMLLCPGNAGSPLVKNIVGDNVILGELSDNLWPCRMTGAAEILVGLPLSAKYAAAYPSECTEKLLEIWKPFLQLKEGRNILETTLNSPNVISHIAGSILNTAAIEQKNGKFAFFEDGLSPSVIKVLAKVEEERNRVLEAAGLRIYQSTVPLLNLLYKNQAKGFDVFRTLEGPESMTHRYISEDAGCGVSLLISTAEVYEIEMPLTKAVLCIAECINDEDYYSEGRTLEKLGIELQADS